MAGSGCKGSDILLQQNEALFLSKEVPDSLIQVRLAIMHDIFNAALLHCRDEMNNSQC